MSTIGWLNGGQTFINVAKDEQSGEMRVHVVDDTPVLKQEHMYTADEAIELSNRHDRISVALRDAVIRLRNQPAPASDGDTLSAPPTA